MSPSRFKEVRIARRVLTVLYIVFVLALCTLTSISIVRTLTHSAGDVPSVPAGSPKAQALAGLSRLYQELRQRVEMIGNNPRRQVDLERWKTWKVEWEKKFLHLGERYRLSRPASAGGDPTMNALREAYRETGSLQKSYERVVQSVAAAREQALKRIDPHLRRASKALTGRAP